MVKLHELLYVDDDTREKLEEIQEAVFQNRILWGVYYITLSKSEKEQLDVFSDFMFYQERKRREELVVVGIAKGKKSAYELIERMALDSYRSTGTCNLRDRFK